MPEQPHPYTEFEGTALWDALNTAIDELVENDDLEERTARQYIVGYLAKQLTEAGLAAGNAMTIGDVLDRYENSEARGRLIVGQRASVGPMLAVIEGPPASLQFVGELMIAWSRADDVCEWDMCPDGTAEDYWFHQRSPMGIMFHRLPCHEGFESILDERAGESS